MSERVWYYGRVLQLALRNQIWRQARLRDRLRDLAHCLSGDLV
ncbi:MAG: hypothetical protein OER80_07930 [Gammaproteobacteria bacterium]|nr:hypothetical protein [Gammaproteobacteria bacterium]MDH3767939.1 hypothetical protein [Gammaproteobacteria bacterium]